MVIQGPGENAGVIDIGDGDAAIFKMESHNHPSFIEPYQGAATGVGGIMRDVFTMGARPVAMMNALRFGEPSHPKTRHLVSGVVVRHRRLRQLHGRAHSGRRSEFPSLLQRQYSGQRDVRGPCPRRQDFQIGGQGCRQSGRLCRFQNRARRHSWRHHGVSTSSAKMRKKNGPPCRWAIPSPRNCCWKPASN